MPEDVNPDDIPRIGKTYGAVGDGGVLDIWRHFTTRGHKGRIQCVMASSWAEYVVTGGVDYTVRVWKFNDRYEAYDLIAMTQMDIPEDLQVKPAHEFSMFMKIKEAVMPTKIEWDDVLKERPRGVSAIFCGAAPHPQCRNLLRNVPIISGNVHGDLYFTELSLTKEESPPKVFYKLHKDQITDIAAVMADASCSAMLVMTGSHDGTAKLLRVTLQEVEMPEFFVHDPYIPDSVGMAVVDTLLRGGGGRHIGRTERQAKEEAFSKKMGIDVEESWLKFTGAEELGVVCDHGSPVLSVRPLGMTRNNDNRATFATCCKEFIGLWNANGDLQTKLWMWTYGPSLVRFDHVADAMVNEELKCDSIDSLATVRKPKGTLLFAKGRDLGGAERVAVWGFENGLVGLKEKDENGEPRGLLSYGKDAEKAFAETPDKGKLEPLCAYHKSGAFLDIDQAGVSTTFAVQLGDDGTTVGMWDLEAVLPSKLVLEPSGPAALLTRPGFDDLLLNLPHATKVTSLRVVEDSEGPALVSADDAGTAFLWDLKGDDAGQIYGEMRSMKALEIVVPVIMLFVTFSQVFSFAFGPSVPWKSEVHTKAVIAHKFMMLDFKTTIKIAKEDIFWPEMTIILSGMIMVLLFTITDMPHLADAMHRAAQEISHPCLMPFKRVLRFLSRSYSRFVYFVIQMAATVLVVPMIQSCAQATDCVWREGFGWKDVLQGGYTTKDVHLASVPTVACYETDHLKLLATMVLVLPPYLLLLWPYAVCAGDAHYISFPSIWDFRVWHKENAWRLASARKATDMHLGFLHPTPSAAFLTLSVELFGKVFLPVITTWTTHLPLLQMSLVTIIGAKLWLVSILRAPYVDRKWTVLVQNLKLIIFMAMAVGAVTVYVDDPESYIPIFILAGCIALVVIMTMVQWLADLKFERTNVVVYRSSGQAATPASPPATSRADEEKPLLTEASRE